MAARNEWIFQDFSPSADDFRHQVLSGLFVRKKSLPSKFLYDAIGSLLFERIAQLEEYYLARIERKIILECRGVIAELVGPSAIILDYGSGTGEKLELILQALRSPQAYLPIDISKAQVLETAEVFMRSYPDVSIFPVCLDFLRPIDLSSLASDRSQRIVAFFLGSTFGNLEPPDGIEFLRNAASTVGPDGAVVVGVDLRKDPGILENAYNDALGVTSQFNLNLLNRMNRELNSDFDLELFQHRAFFNPRKSRIEMYLACRKAHVAHVSGFPVSLEEGEMIHTENAYKYSIKGFHELAREAGFMPQAVWTDPFEFFSLHFLVQTASPVSTSL